MVDDDEEFLDTQWTERTRAAFLAAGEALIVELRAHMRLVGSATAASSVTAEFTADEAVTRAAIAYGDAELDLTGGPGPFVLLDTAEDGEARQERDLEALAPASVVTVLQRADYAVVDDLALLAAAEVAHRRLQPEHPPKDDEMATVGYAMAEIAHADGWEALDGAPGLQPLGAVRYLLAPSQHVAITDPSDGGDLETNLVIDGRLLFTVGDVY